MFRGEIKYQKMGLSENLTEKSNFETFLLEIYNIYNICNIYLIYIYIIYILIYIY